MIIDKASIGSRIRQIRNKESQTEFAHKLGFSQSYIADIEGGRTKPSLELLLSIIANYDISLNWILTGDGQKNKNDLAPITVSDSNICLVEDMELKKVIDVIASFWRDASPDERNWFKMQFWSVLPVVFPILNDWYQKRYLTREESASREIS